MHAFVRSSFEDAAFLVFGVAVGFGVATGDAVALGATLGAGDGDAEMAAGGAVGEGEALGAEELCASAVHGKINDEIKAATAELKRMKTSFGEVSV